MAWLCVPILAQEQRTKQLPEETKDTSLNDGDGPPKLSPHLPFRPSILLTFGTPANPSLLLLTYDDDDHDGDACQPFPSIPEFRSGIKLAANSLLVSECERTRFILLPSLPSV
jgi:hypothetical protein